MEILNFRVDDRLVHGIVATYWIPYLRVDRAMVIDKESAENPMLKSALRMATPASVNLSVITLDKAIENLKEEKYGNEKIMIVVKDPEVFAELVRAGIKIDKVTMGNIGNIDKKPGSIVLTRYLTVTPEHVETLEFLKSQGAAIVSRLTTSDAEEDFFEILAKKK